jgi:hypothetical protein
MEETCPACGFAVHFDGESDAHCANGHIWGNGFLACLCMNLTVERLRPVFRDLFHPDDTYAANMFRLHPKDLPSAVLPQF